MIKTLLKPGIGLAGCLIASSCGLEVAAKSDVRSALKACTLESNTVRAIMCTALLHEAELIKGPVVVIETGADIFEQELRKRNIDLESFPNNLLSIKYARANIFALNNLSTGKFNTIDGVSHTVVCTGNVCQIDSAIEGAADRLDVSFTGGKLYSMSGILPF